MTNINNKKIVKPLIKDFLFKNTTKDFIELKFLKKISKTKICVSKKTGLVFHNKFKSSKEVLEEWSKKIYVNKKSGKDKGNLIKQNKYSDDFPGMSARHFYVLDFLSRFIKFKNKKIIDFACGEGGLLIKAKKYFNVKNSSGVEHSKRNILYIKQRFKSEKIKLPNLYQSNIESFLLKEKADVGILTWTLCNCSEPLKIVESISKNLKKNGYLIVAESSRILVPFKKPIHNCFHPKSDVGHTHPWHWSYNSLSNIFKIYGFELIKSNRYWDENDLVLIFKNSKKFNQNFIFDNYLKVIDFFKRWKMESKNYKFSR
tara:strand:+ start:218 stop:1162 length:945 start_codon:yes stop_codon:yes gene_type:complete